VTGASPAAPSAAQANAHGRRLIVIEYVSLDGVTQAPGHAAEDTEGGFAYGGWTGPFMGAHGRYMREALNTMGALLLGRLTYDIWAQYWPTVTDPTDEITRLLNAVPKYVASTTMRAGSWAETTTIGDVPVEVAELKRQAGKDIVVMGSSDLVQSLIEHQLVDEYRLMIHPVVLGSGKRLFREGAPMSAFRLIDATTTSSGLVTAAYAT
jgi:dihydrofolate reductase